MQREFAPGAKVADIAAAFGMTTPELFAGREEGRVEVRRFPNGSQIVTVSDTLTQTAPGG